MEKVYGGNARIVETKFGQLWKVSQSKKDLENLLKYLNDNNLEWVTSAIKEKQEKAQGKPTHYLQVDEWKPNATAAPKQAQAMASVNKFEGDAFPF